MVSNLLDLDIWKKLSSLSHNSLPIRATWLLWSSHIESFPGCVFLTIILVGLFEVFCFKKRFWALNVDRMCSPSLKFPKPFYSETVGPNDFWSLKRPYQKDVQQKVALFWNGGTFSSFFPDVQTVLWGRLTWHTNENCTPLYEDVFPMKNRFYPANWAVSWISRRRIWPTELFNLDEFGVYK